MAITVSNRQWVNLGNKTGVICNIDHDATAYTAGGLALTAATVGLKKIEGATWLGATTSVASGVVPVYDHVAGKLQCFETGAGLSGFLAECGSESLDAYSHKFLFVGY